MECERLLTEQQTPNIQQATIDLWRNTVESCTKYFAIEEPICINKILIDSTKSKSWPEAWDTEARVEGNHVIIPNIGLAPAPLIKAIYAREAFKLLIPQGVADDRIIKDLAIEYGCQNLDRKMEKKWIEQWAQTTNIVVLPNAGRYDPVRIFKYLERTEGRHVLKRLVKFLLQLHRAGLKISLDDWVKYLITTSQNLAIPLNKAELRVIDVLLSNPQFTRDDLVKHLNLSTDWASKTLQRLLTRGQLIKFERISFRALNIKVIELIIESTDIEKPPMPPVLENFPFLYATRQILNGRGGVLATLAIPENKQNIDATMDLIDKIANNQYIVQYFERDRAKRFHCFDHYSIEKGVWNIDWFKLWSRMKNIIGKKEKYTISLDLPDPPEKAKHLDNIDAILIAEFQRGVKQVRKLRDRAQCRTTVVVDKLKNLRQKGIIAKFYELRHVGLGSEVLLCGNIKSQELLRSLALNLPLSYVQSNPEGEVLVKSKLPKTGPVNLAQILGDFDIQLQVHILGSAIYGRWQLTDFMADWNFYHGTWDSHPHVE